MARSRATTSTNNNTNNMNRSKTQQQQQQQKGRETGVVIPISRIAVRDDGMESPSAFFRAASSPPEEDEGEGIVMNGGVPLVNELEPRSKKKETAAKRIRFSMDGEDNNNTINNYNDDDDEKKETDGTTTTTTTYQHVTQKIGRHVSRLRSAGRTSMDTADLSTVTTAPSNSPSPSKTTSTSKKQQQQQASATKEEETIVFDEDDDNDEVDVKEEPEEEEMAIDQQDEQEVVLAHQRNNNNSPSTNDVLDTTEQSIVLLQQDSNDNEVVDELDDNVNEDDDDDLIPPPPPAAEDLDDNDDDDDDLIPPPPPPHDASFNSLEDEVDEEKMTLEPQKIKTPSTFGGKSPRSSMKVSPAVSFSAINDVGDDDDDDDDDDDKEGQGFQMADVESLSGSSKKKKKGGTPTRSQQKLPTAEKKRRQIQAENTDDDDDDDGDKEKEEMDATKSSARASKRVRLNQSIDSSRSMKPAVSKKKGKKKYITSDDDNEEETTIKTKMKKPKKEKKNTGKNNYFASQGIAQPRQFTVIPVSDLKPAATPSSSSSSFKNNNNQQILRRSKRMHIKPLEFWRGEYVEYGPNDFPEDDIAFRGVKNMSIPKYVRKAEPTPYKPRKVVMPKKQQQHQQQNTTDKKNNNKNNKGVGGGAVVEVLQFDDTNLRKKYHYKDGDKANLWDSVDAHSKETVAIARAEKFKFKDLPITRERKSSEGSVVGKAAQAFYVFNKNNRVYPGYIMGKLLLPPKGIKDAECVGSCAQTFTVVAGQPGSLELAYADPNTNNGKMNLETASRFLLGPGDVFRVPPGNCYRLQNHSKKNECIMTWTIIRPTQNYDSE